MSTPVARYVVIIDRYLTDDCDGTGLYHDGSGEDAVKQMTRELQEAWECGGVTGHFRVTERQVFLGDNFMPGGYAGQALPTCYTDDPPEYRRKLRYWVKQIKVDTPDDEGLEVYYGIWDEQSKALCPGRLFWTLYPAESEAKHLNVLHEPIRLTDDEGSSNE